MPHRVTYTVYYEDTDCLGVVYYANYLKFMERGRSEFVASLGQGVAEWNAQGYLLVVHSLTMAFKRPARLGDRVEVVTDLSVDSPYRGTFHQRIERDGELLTEGDVVIVCLQAGADGEQRLVELPDGLRAASVAPPTRRVRPGIPPGAGRTSV